VIDAEAAREGAPVFKVRKLITGARPDSDVTLWLDALDEYRTEGESSDKVYRLAHAIAAAKVPRWRLSCRSEDWRKSADIAAVHDTTAGAPIVVAQLLPLDRAEATAVLAALGEDAPDAFLTKAEALGAAGFIESPLSLNLLHKAVAGGDNWPTTRYDLFETAIRRLVHEHNDEHRWTDRCAPDEIIAAGEACLVLLVSGSRTLWRSNAEPPTEAGDTRAYVTAHDLRFDRRLLRDVLDTTLFRGEGEAFEPMHRTVAEFLAGQALARAVIGGRDRAALPLLRALAMITSEYESPPTELRGIYAWLAAHLARLGDEAGAMRLIEADAVTVLAYGDAAVFATPARRAILAHLDRHDPYFRSSEVGVTAVGGLAGEDLAGDFTAVLSGRSDGTHRLLTVLEALTHGRPIASIRPLLRARALDPERPEVQRWRAADAWLNGADDPTVARRALLDDLAGEPVSIGREALRAHLSAELPSQAISLTDIKSLIADYQQTPEDHTIGRLWRLRRKLAAQPRPELFDEPTNTWRPQDTQRPHAFEINDLLDHVLAASIHKTADLTAARLWRWTVNMRDYVTANLDAERMKAVTAWIDEQPGRDVDLFDVVLAEDDLANGPFWVSHIYTNAFGRRPSAGVIRHVLAKSAAAPTKAAAKRLLEIAVAIARQPGTDVDAYWETHDRLARHPSGKALLKQLSTTKIEPWQRDNYKRAAKRRREHAKHRAGNIKRLNPLLGDLRVGRRPGPLDWAAQLYFGVPGGDGERLAGAERIVHFTDRSTADAIFAGWEFLATVDLVGVNAATLGTAEAEGRRYCVEWPAIGGLDRLLEEDRLPDPGSMPISLATAVIKSSFIVDDQERRKRLEQWAIDRLNLDPILGASQLLDYFSASLDAGATQLTAISRLSEDDTPGGAVAQATDRLLATRPAMPPEALRSLLPVAARHLNAPRLQELAEAALADPAVVDRQRAIWTVVVFALDPVAHSERLIAEYNGLETLELFDESLMDGFFKAFHVADGGARVAREAAFVRLLGRTTSPDHELYSGRVTREARLSGTVRQSIEWLASRAQPDAGAALARLIEDADLAEWRPSLRHARAQQARLQRDRNFKHPTPTKILAAVDGGPPVNAADLRAVALEELTRLRAELRTNNTTPWKRYWNLNPTVSLPTLV
jgi:hypothetical protein